MQASLSLRSHHGTRLRQPKLRSNYGYRGDDNNRADDKDRTERGRRLTVVKLTKGLEQYANL